MLRRKKRVRRRRREREKRRWSQEEGSRVVCWGERDLWV